MPRADDAARPPPSLAPEPPVGGSEKTAPLGAARTSPAPVPPVPTMTHPPALTFTGKKYPPPGSPADQALLGELLMAQGNMLNQRAWAITATQRLADGGHDKRLAALQATQPPEAAEKTERVRKRLLATWDEVSRIMTARWFVDGRIGCRPQAISFEVLMPAAEAQSGERLAATREGARKCLDRQMLTVRPLEKANRDLDAAWREANSVLAGTEK